MKFITFIFIFLTSCISSVPITDNCEQFPENEKIEIQDEVEKEDPVFDFSAEYFFKIP